MQPRYTPSEKVQQVPNIQPHDVAVSVPLDERSYRHPDASAGFARKDKGWLRRVARASALR